MHSSFGLGHWAEAKMCDVFLIFKSDMSGPKPSIKVDKHLSIGHLYNQLICSFSAEVRTSSGSFRCACWTTPQNILVHDVVASDCNKIELVTQVAQNQVEPF